MKNTSDGLTDMEYERLQGIAARYDAEAKPRKDRSLNMRISTQDLESIKLIAARQGFKNYQTWVMETLKAAMTAA